MVVNGMKKIVQARRKPQGFTFIELIIAIAILSVAVTVLLVVFASVTEQTVMSELLSVDTYLAEQELERITGMRFSQVASSGPTAYGGDFSDYEYEITVSPVPVALAADPAMSQYKQVEVTVRHATAGAVSLTTIVTNN